MLTSFIIVAVVIFLVIDVSVAMIISKAGMSFALGLIPVFQFFMLGKLADKYIVGVVVACLAAITGILSFYNFSIGFRALQVPVTYEPEQTIMVDHMVQDAQGNVISHTVSYEPVDNGDLATDRFLDAMESPEVRAANSISNILEIIEFVFYIILMYGVCGKFSKGIGFLIGIIFLPFIFLPIMALDGSYYGNYI